MQLATIYAAFDTVKSAIGVASYARDLPEGIKVGSDIEQVVANAESAPFLHPQWGPCRQTPILECGMVRMDRFVHMLGVDLFAGETSLHEVRPPLIKRLSQRDQTTVFVKTTGTRLAAQEQARREKICLATPLDVELISLYAPVPSFEVAAEIITRHGCAPAGVPLINSNENLEVMRPSHPFFFVVHRDDLPLPDDHKELSNVTRDHAVTSHHVLGYPWSVFVMLQFIAPRSVFEAALSLAAGEPFPSTIPNECASIALTVNSWLIKTFIIPNW